MKAKWTLMQRYADIQQRTGQSPVLQAACYQRAAKREDGTMDFILSMPGIKRDGFDIVQDGWLLDDYRENNVVLWRHSDKLPSDIMGNSPKVWHSNAGGLPLHLRGRLQWATEKQNPQIGPIRALYEDYVLRATSVRWEDDGIDSLSEITADELCAAKVDPMVLMYAGGIRFNRARLTEWSLVPLGMDKQALSIRCQRGDIPAGQLDALVATIKDEQLVTDDGREVLILDGHPARFETERNLTVDLGAQGYKDPVVEAKREKFNAQAKAYGEFLDGVNETLGRAVASEAASLAGLTVTDGLGGVTTYQTVDPPVRVAPAQVAWTQYPDLAAYKADCQRYLRGSLSGEGLSEHLEAEAVRLATTAPDTQLLARTYRDLHQSLADAVAQTNEVEAGVLREVIVKVGQRLFGEGRLRESWEPRALPEPKLVWASVSSLLEVGLREVVVDGEERDARIDTLITALDAAIGDNLRYAEEAGGLIVSMRAALNVEDDSFDALLRAVQPIQREAESVQTEPAVTQRTEAVPAQAEPEVDHALVELANHLEARVHGRGKSKSNLLKSLLASLPAD